MFNKSSVVGCMMKLHTSAFSGTKLRHLLSVSLCVFPKVGRIVINFLYHFWSWLCQLLMLISAVVLPLSYLCPVLLSISETVVDNSEPWKSELLSLIVHKAGYNCTFLNRSRYCMLTHLPQKSNSLWMIYVQLSMRLYFFYFSTMSIIYVLWFNCDVFKMI